MFPITILAARKFVNMLTFASAIESEVNLIATQSQTEVPTLPVYQVFLSAVPEGMAQLNQQLGYPRISVFASKVKNQQKEKFRSLSGFVTVTAEVAATSDRLDQVTVWIHFYVEAITNILRRNIGDWGDGVFFPGPYEVQMQPPKAGANGFLQLAQVTCDLGVSRN